MATPRHIKLDSFYVIPGYTFFYWGFTLPKREYPSFGKHFGFKSGHLLHDIQINIAGKYYAAKIRLARIKTKRFPNRDVVQIYYDSEQETLKALRKLFIYSYAATISKSKSDLKELLELVHVSGNKFLVKVISRQRTDFESMFKFLEDKNIFDYWKDAKSGKRKNFIIVHSSKWLSVDELREYENRVNVIYLLYNSRMNQLYVGKANRMGDRVKRGRGRVGLDKDWDKFMYFEIDPEFNPFIEQIEAFAIKIAASLLPNDVEVPQLKDRRARLVNRQLRKK